MALEYVVTELPPVWPGKRMAYPRRSPFKTQWTRTLKLLAREIRALSGRKVEMALALRAGGLDLRQDGKLRGDARPGHAVIVSFVDSDGVRHRYPCDRFAWWQDNVYAIAKALEALRLVERYGVQSDLVRAGFKALPSSTTPTLNTEQAAEVLSRYAGDNGAPASRVLESLDVAREVARKAKARTHPDAGGRSGDFQLVTEAARIVGTHHRLPTL